MSRGLGAMDPCSLLLSFSLPSSLNAAAQGYPVGRQSCLRLPGTLETKCWNGGWEAAFLGLFLELYPVFEFFFFLWLVGGDVSMEWASAQSLGLCGRH